MLNGEFFFSCLWMYVYLIIYTTLLMSMYMLYISACVNGSVVNNNFWNTFVQYFNDNTSLRIIHITQILSLAGAPPLILFWIKVFILQKLLYATNMIGFIYYICYFLFLLYFYMKYFKTLLPVQHYKTKRKCLSIKFSSTEKHVYIKNYYFFDLLILIVFCLLELPLWYNDFIIFIRFVFTV